eukprot:4889201-Lingulodinium_polyedra.AAC.1
MHNAQCRGPFFTRTPGGPMPVAARPTMPRPCTVRAPGGRARHSGGAHGCTLLGVRSRPWDAAGRQRPQAAKQPSPSRSTAGQAAAR